MSYLECSIYSCGNPVFARGFCRKHYDKDVERTAPPCSVSGCNRVSKRSGMCDAHYRSELKKRSPLCSVYGCDLPVKAKGYCDKHYQRLHARGSVEQTRADDWGAREKHPLYKSWVWHKRSMPTSMCKEWAEDFWLFVDTVGERPKGYNLRRIDNNRPIGPTNWEWKETTPSKDKAEYMRQWVKNNPRKERNFYLKKKYGITADDYDTMEAAQGGKCAICGGNQTKRYKNFSVDHCHITGKVRGLLCSPCNKALGSFKDDVDILKTAINYLIKSRVP